MRTSFFHTSKWKAVPILSPCDSFKFHTASSASLTPPHFRNSSQIIVFFYPMVFPGDLETALQEDSTQLSPEVKLQARIKNDEINRSLGLSPEQDPSDEELMDFDVGQIVEDSNSNYFSEEELQQIALKNQFLDAEIGQQEDSNKVENAGSASTGSEQFISQVEVVSLNDADMSCQMEVEAGGIGLIIPPELHDNLAAGGLKLVLEPVLPTVPGQSVTFNITTVPTTPPANANQPCSESSAKQQCSESNAKQSCSESEGGSDSDSSESAPKKKRRGLGSAHKGGEVNSYSLWMRIGITSDIRLENMTPKDACDKWKAPRRRLRQWLLEYDRGDYADLPTRYTQEELKKRTRLKGGGAKLKDEVLEERLVNYYNQLQEELYPITTELLAYECLTHNEKFLGGATSPQFTKRISDFLRHWRRRNLKRLRKPTTTGQKLPDGYTGKWEACSYYFYLETKGVPKKNVWHGDETKIVYEDTPGKVYADAGAKRVPVRTSGQEKDNLTGFLVQNAEGDKLPLYPILRGDTTANRPGMHTKKNNSSIRQ